jgi:hypothetical protein
MNNILSYSGNLSETSVWQVVYTAAAGKYYIIKYIYLFCFFYFLPRT